MNQEELIARAVEHARILGTNPDWLENARVQEVAIVHFECENSGENMEVYLDVRSGDFLRAIYVPPDSTQANQGT
jgi:hypothetical protein